MVLRIVTTAALIGVAAFGMLVLLAGFVAAGRADDESEREWQRRENEQEHRTDND